jgi:hypothetical protein
MSKMTLFWNPTGPKLTYGDGTFHISDLNPQIEHEWRMSRREMIILGWRCIVAAVRA